MIGCNIMHTPTYATLILLLFIKNINSRQANSIKQVIDLTDALAQKLGYSLDISYMTKFNIVKDMIATNILVGKHTKKRVTVRLSTKIRRVIVESPIEEGVKFL